MADVNARLDDLGSAGTVNPFRETQKIVFREFVTLPRALMLDPQDTDTCVSPWSMAFFFLLSFLLSPLIELTIRKVGCDEIADDPKLRARILNVVEVTDNGHALATFLFPWLPLPKVLRKIWSSVTMYRTVRRVVRDREITGRRGKDALQVRL